ncbi:MAG: hypothetical protein WC587_00475 [Candidatus Paceibacterota bacterium]
MSKVKNKTKISIRDKYAKGELAKDILKGLAIGGLIVASFALPNLPQVFNFFGIKNSKEKFKLNRALRNLQSQKLIDIYKKGNDMVMEITEKGNKKILKYKFDELELIRPKKWDGYWRVIVFDIPEKYKKARSALTNKLKEMEFYPLQKSVFVCPFECDDEIDFITEFFNVRRFVRFLLVKEINQDNFLKQFYNL